MFHVERDAFSRARAEMGGSVGDIRRPAASANPGSHGGGSAPPAPGREGTGREADRGPGPVASPNPGSHPGGGAPPAPRRGAKGRGGDRGPRPGAGRGG